MSGIKTTRLAVEGGVLEVEERGSGEPVVFVHGALAEAFRPLLDEPALEGYRLVSYSRRGYGGSTAPAAPMPIAEQAADCRSVLGAVAIERAHLVGHSYGGNVILELALDEPQAVASLALLEAALPSVLLAAPEFGKAIGEAMARYGAGDNAAALDVFLTAACGPGYRQTLDRGLGPEGFDRALAGLDTLFQKDFPALQEWRFGEEEARRVRAPALCVVGEANAAGGPFKAIQDFLTSALPAAEGFELPGATHLLMLDNAPGLAHALAGFLARHPVAEAVEA